MTGICGASSRLAMPYPGSARPLAPGLGDRGSELVHRACRPERCLLDGAHPPTWLTPPAGLAARSVRCHLGRGWGPVACVQLSPPASLSPSSGKAWAWAAPDPTPRSPSCTAVQRQALAGPCSGLQSGTAARLVTAEEAPEGAAPWGGDPGPASLLFRGLPSLPPCHGRLWAQGPVLWASY